MSLKDRKGWKQPMSQGLMGNQYKEANMPLTADQGIAVAIVEDVAVTEGGITEDDSEDHLDQKEQERRKVIRMIKMIKISLKQKKDPDVVC